MSASNFKHCLDLLLKSEGGFVNDSRDSGGITNLGITQKALEEWLGHDVDEKFMRKLTPEMAAPFYEQKYWRPCYGEVLPKGLDFLVFSFGINAGCGRSIKILQSTIGVVPDGIIGERVMGKLRESNIANVIKSFSESRRTYYKSLKSFPVFGRGWISRTDNEEAEAIQMVKNG